MARYIDPYTKEYMEYEEAFNYYWDTKKQIEKYADEYRITTDDSVLALLRPLKRKLPQLASDKRRAWGKVLRLTREAQNDE
ncbi:MULTISPECIES: hypothetical protein [Bacillus cereus group]|uniref:hypothetical protein n=1 Tax=Bacillus cereus group TaxID=86661 RepID=UPI000BED4BF4|nr:MULTISPECIES: hypothetical protein [Bacillus cereus group]PEF88531.1 hypothetical protein CON51_04835 [Bacillus thuringiensis]PES54708.1 hypothetical protein CN506_19635 [Bacillus thuringiensis]PFP03600.1 hypothetical protein COJ91_22685 [Bacillus thuringiensis]PFS55664.1 hypothetical protein COK64_23245 [Bacillus thuringiensis]PGL62316.1 hypothetical protein CN939_19410 [Bacillus thuringiensis]